MHVVLTIIAIYIGLGIVALLLLEAITHRITRKLDSATLETTDKLAHTGNIVSIKMAKTILVLALFIFWPSVIYGTLTKEKLKSAEVSPLKKKFNDILDFDFRDLIKKKKGDDNDGQKS
jgi:hypothetical protein